MFANEKKKIIENFNNIETLKFDFIQISNDNKENGNCFLKRPHFLKCEYKNENKKELIINRRNLVIYHKKFNKMYYYPVSKSYFADILNREKFANLISNGNINLYDDGFGIKYFSEDKGNIIFFFHKENLNLIGWEFIDFNENHTSFKINNLRKNETLDKKLFAIPEAN